LFCFRLILRRSQFLLSATISIPIVGQPRVLQRFPRKISMGSPTPAFCPHPNNSNRSESMDDKLTTSSILQQEITLGLTSTSVNPCSEILTTAAETNLSIDTSSHLMGLSSDRSDSTGSHTPPPLTCTHHLLQPHMPKELTTTPKKISKRQLFRSPDCVATSTRSPHCNSNGGRSSAGFGARVEGT